MKKETKTQREARLINETIHQLTNQSLGRQSAAEFIQNVLTEAEQKAIGRRLLIARLYLEGYSGADIRALLHVSPNMLTLVRRWLEKPTQSYSSVYRSAQERREPMAQPKGRAVPPPLGFARLRKQYPLHFLLFNLIAELKKPK